MVRNGGRNGIALSAGFRWKLGKEGKPIEKVQRVNNSLAAQTDRKIVKQLNDAQKITYGSKTKNTTKQLTTLQLNSYK